MKVRITKTRPDVELPKYETHGACCFDFLCVEDAVIEPKKIALLPTGLVICVPEGYMLMLASRSSTPMKKGLMFPHGIGILDRDYCGPDDEVRIQVYNFTDAPVALKKGDRIAQGGFVRTDAFQWDEGPADGPTRGGFGSTG